MDNEYFPILILAAVILVAGGIFWLGAVLFGPRRANDTKGMPFEHGNVSFGTGGKRFVAGYFLTAILFLLLDITVLFIFPWAALLKSLELPAIIGMFLFLGVMGISLIYIWSKGAAEWE